MFRWMYVDRKHKREYSNNDLKYEESPRLKPKNTDNFNYGSIVKP